MKLIRPVALLLCLGLASAALGITPPTYSALRQQFPQINTAVAAMPSSDLNGTFNRLSAILHRAQVDSAANFTQLPSNYEKNMEATLEDLRADLANVGSLSDDDALTIIQVVRLLAFKRNVELFGAFCTPTPCDPFPCTPTPCIDTRAFYLTLRDIVSEINPVYQRIRANSSQAVQDGSAASLTPNTLIPGLQTFLTIKGVESIDD